MLCKQCKTDKPPSEFLWGGRKGNSKIKFCNTCSGANMRRYWATRMVGKKPEEFRELSD